MKFVLLLFLAISTAGLAQKQDVSHSALVSIQFARPAAISKPEQVSRDSETLDLTAEMESGRKCTNRKEVLDWAPQYRDFEDDLKKRLAEQGLIYIPLRAADDTKVSVFKVVGKRRLYGFWMNINLGFNSQGVFRLPFTRLAWCLSE